MAERTVTVGLKGAQQGEAGRTAQLPQEEPN